MGCGSSVHKNDEDDEERVIGPNGVVRGNHKYSSAEIIRRKNYVRKNSDCIIQCSPLQVAMKLHMMTTATATAASRRTSTSSRPTSRRLSGNSNEGSESPTSFSKLSVSLFSFPHSPDSSSLAESPTSGRVAGSPAWARRIRRDSISPAGAFLPSPKGSLPLNLDADSQRDQDSVSASSSGKVKKGSLFAASDFSSSATSSVVQTRKGGLVTLLLDPTAPAASSHTTALARRLRPGFKLYEEKPEPVFMEDFSDSDDEEEDEQEVIDAALEGVSNVSATEDREEVEKLLLEDPSSSFVPWAKEGAQLPPAASSSILVRRESDPSSLSSTTAAGSAAKYVTQRRLSEPTDTDTTQIVQDENVFPPQVMLLSPLAGQIIASPVSPVDGNGSDPSGISGGIVNSQEEGWCNHKQNQPPKAFRLVSSPTEPAPTT